MDNGSKALFIVRSRINNDVFIGTPEVFGNGTVGVRVVMKGEKNNKYEKTPAIISFVNDNGVLSSDFFTVEALEDVQGDQLAVDVETQTADVQADPQIAATGEPTVATEGSGSVQV